MKRNRILLCSVLLCTSLIAGCRTPSTPPENNPQQPIFPYNTQIDTSLPGKVETYQNPVLSHTLPEANANCGFGDPFVMRHNGVYYLYSTPSNYPTCWSSTDLIHWTYRGEISSDPLSVSCYAPEVFYYNGYFYMYASPRGEGHYVFRASSPVGPFEAVTENMQMSIDGSVFVDRDGTWYFYTAAHDGIQYYRMTSPTAFEEGGKLDSLHVSHGWSEGPMVIYHDGYYYATYTGNHFLSPSYRILYSSTASSPIDFPENKDNPLLIHTNEPMLGIGHSSTVKGPDLDSYYMVYHSLVDKRPNRDMNIDRIVFNGTHMAVQGPTLTEQAVPSMPDVYAYFDGEALPNSFTLTGAKANQAGFALTEGSYVLSERAFSGNFTAEYHITGMAQNGIAGVLFSYTDDQNYGALLFDTKKQAVRIRFVQNGQQTETTVPMIQSFSETVRHDCTQALQIEKKGNTYSFYMNDIPLYTAENSLPAGRIGYLAERGEASLGFIGGTGAVGGQGNADSPKTLSFENSYISADEYTLGTFEAQTKKSTEYVIAKESAVLNYRILASENGSYDLIFRYASNDGAQATVYLDGQEVCRIVLPKSTSPLTDVKRAIPINRGQHTLSLKINEGSASFAWFKLPLSGPEATIEKDFSSEQDDPIYTDGNWILENGTLSMNLPSSSAKRLYGDPRWGDYTVECDVTYTKSGNSALLVRVTEPSSPALLGEEHDPLAGGDSFLGYSVGILNHTAYIGRHSYGYEHVASVQLTLVHNKTYRMRVACCGANIKMYLDGQLCIDYTDPNPFLQGMAGMRSHLSANVFDNFKVMPLT